MLVLAHRGANRQAPENTVPAMARAVELGADGVELDVHRTADGALVVRHDAETPVGPVTRAHPGRARGRPARGARCSPRSSTSAGAGWSTSRSRTRTRGPVDALVALLEARGGGGRRCWCRRSTSPPSTGCATLAPDVPSALPRRSASIPSRRSTPPATHGHDALHPDVWTLLQGDPREVAERAHGDGMRVNVWTVNERRRAAAPPRRRGRRRRHRRARPRLGSGASGRDDGEGVGAVG